MSDSVTSSSGVTERKVWALATSPSMRPKWSSVAAGQGEAAVAVGHVATPSPRCSAPSASSSAADRLQPLGLAAGHHQTRPPAGQVQGQAPADATGGAGQDHDLAGHVVVDGHRASSLPRARRSACGSGRSGRARRSRSRPRSSKE